MREPFVFHFVAHREHAERGERIATMCIEPAKYAQLGRRRVERGIELERQKWQRLVLADQGPGWAVRVVREVGYVRSVFPGAALRSAPAPAPVIAVAGQGGPIS